MSDPKRYDTTISQLIAELNALLAEYGDLPVYAFNDYYDTRCAHASIEEAELNLPLRVQIHA